MQELSNIATPPELDENSVERNPIDLFRRWFDDALASRARLPNAMTLATATADGKPSARMVLLKQVDEEGFVFYTNYRSRKAAELESNPRAALVFYWTYLDRQVRVEGTITRVSAAESDEYFATRPRESQLGAQASPQSAVIASRKVLEESFRELEERYQERPVERPEHWGGYRLAPDSIEFWQSREGRLHDRIAYERQADGDWSIQRLAP
ncbi:MAG TPA: pyridoxamine 5'-phosphate oxidase [Pyrinomonadaceae bacterium]|nr:pyridoxamine 5'-phosphate oxidase [Pyrinomonadaceae bacterium]